MRMIKKKVICSFVAAVFLLTASGCLSDDSAIFKLLKKQNDLVVDIGRQINENYGYDYESLDDYKKNHSNILSNYLQYKVENNESWVSFTIYADADDRVIMEIFDANKDRYYKNILHILSGSTQACDVSSFAKQNGNIIDEIRIGVDEYELYFNFDFTDFLSDMINLKKVTFKNCKFSNDFPCMDNMFSNNNKLESVEFIGCDLSAVNSMRNMFLNCSQLQRCDFLHSVLNENIDVTDMFTGVNFDVCKIYTTNGSISASYPEYIYN